MHELSLAQRITEIVRESVKDEPLSTVRTISIAVGELANVNAESLMFAFEALVDGTDLQDASLNITSVPVEILCLSCDKLSTLNDFIFQCVHCGSTSTDVCRGRELDVTSIEVDDHT